MSLFRVLLFAVMALLATTAGPALAATGVGFQTVRITDPDAQTVEVGVWYPTDAPERSVRLGLGEQTVSPAAAPAGRNLPLVVVSHGNGGWFGSHYDTAIALARAGFVVAALTHSGDNYADQSRATDMPLRPRQLHRLIDYMVDEWPDHASIDPDRIGAFGFSSGGFTVLASAGGAPDLTRVAPHCKDHPGFYDCRLVTAHAVANPPRAEDWVHDRRIKALVVAAPALGFTFAPSALARVTAPIQLWRAADDHILPAPLYADAVREALPVKPEFHLVANADHFDFLPPCSEALAKQAPAICESRLGFDRARFHTDFNRQVTAFFVAHLGKRKP